VACYSFDHIGTYINCFGRYELHELNGLSKIFPALRGSDALDVGANIGNHTLFFSEFFNRVHSFEPNPRTFELLKFNTFLKDNISIYKLGASNQDGVVEATINPTNVGGASIATGGPSPDKKNSIEFEVKRLDDLRELREIKKIGFIKIDVEGHELLALEGMKGIIGQHKPVIAFEQGSAVSEEASIVSWLRGCGYSHFYEIKVIHTKIPKSVPGILRFPWRSFEILTNNFPKIKVQKLVKVEPKFYHMIIASADELNVS
jgi:FkbM family methyltransferase